MKSEPAFPVVQLLGSNGEQGWRDGMTLRDYFAAKAMQGILAECPSVPENQFSELVTEVVSQSFAIADAMLQEREKSA